MLHDLKERGYAVDAIPQSPRALLDLLEAPSQGLSLADYTRRLGERARRGPRRRRGCLGIARQRLRWHAPLWPAGHLPHKGGDQQLSLGAFLRNVYN